jgi:hypothetical protein
MKNDKLPLPKIRVFYYAHCCILSPSRQEFQVVGGFSSKCDQAAFTRLRHKFAF